ncbi:uncharacterized protein S101441_04445 [Bacillus subtilis subsp. subtilis]|nr:uncharacterized protein S101441_04445 [Bacillus subtilis subsp. subtilis]ASB72231.1 uncharacterized protein S100333_04372 [Bacillus subtilis subsp. subtilis]
MTIIKYSTTTLCGNFNSLKGFRLGISGENRLKEFILGFLIFIQGLSFIFFYCHKKQYPKAAAVIAVILGFVHPVFMAAIRILGVLDMGFHIRNKVK